MFQALKTISDAIDKVKYSTGTKKAAAFQAPAPAQLRFVSQEQVEYLNLFDAYGFYLSHSLGSLSTFPPSLYSDSTFLECPKITKVRGQSCKTHFLKHFELLKLINK